MAYMANWEISREIGSGKSGTVTGPNSEVVVMSATANAIMYASVEEMYSYTLEIDVREWEPDK